MNRGLRAGGSLKARALINHRLGNPSISPVTDPELLRATYAHVYPRIWAGDAGSMRDIILIQRLYRWLESLRYRCSNSASNLGRFVLDRALRITLCRWIA